MTTTTATAPAKAYSPAQQAARDYMTAQKVIDTLAEQAKPAKEAQKAALDTLTGEYGADKDHDVKTAITGCWNVPLTFIHRTDETTKWAKVMEALRPHLTADQRITLDAILEANKGTRTTRKVEA